MMLDTHTVYNISILRYTVCLVTLISGELDMPLKKPTLFCYALIVASFSYASSPTDKDIDTQINMLYEKNPILNEKKIHSKTDNQHVVLKGCVKNHAEKELAEDLAGLVDYIDHVDNKIQVNSHPTKHSKNSAPIARKVSDSFISRLVHAKLMLDSTINSDIHVTTLNGITILAGKVASLKEKNHAAEIAFKSKGVVDVVNKLQVAQR